jgi:3-deoxy-D-manno-octulosonate 8-phosphate phosphatase (KDO 8-P phosphatase)
LDAYEQIIADLHIGDEQVAYMGDDVVDLPVLARAGLSAAPADARDEVRALVDWVSQARGGDGAARDLIEVILRAQGKWEAVLREYVRETPVGARSETRP